MSGLINVRGARSGVVGTTSGAAAAGVVTLGGYDTESSTSGTGQTMTITLPSTTYKHLLILVHGATNTLVPWMQFYNSDSTPVVQPDASCAWGVNAQQLSSAAVAHVAEAEAASKDHLFEISPVQYGNDASFGFTMWVWGAGVVGENPKIEWTGFSTDYRSRIDGGGRFTHTNVITHTTRLGKFVIGEIRGVSEVSRVGIASMTAYLYS